MSNCPPCQGQTTRVTLTPLLKLNTPLSATVRDCVYPPSNISQHYAFPSNLDSSELPLREVIYPAYSDEPITHLNPTQNSLQWTLARNSAHLFKHIFAARYSNTHLRYNSFQPRNGK